VPQGCRCIDETPGAYKAIDDVMRRRPTSSIVHTLKQTFCVKG
jgi:RNA-splicing ligase RtcB